MIQTKNFNPATDKKLLCTCGHPKCDKRSVKQGLLNSVQLARSDANRAFTVRSGGRCPYHPDEQHRTTPADHQKQQGIDLAVSGGFQRGEMVALGLKYGFNAIGIAKTFIHWGKRPGEKLVMWVY